MNSKKTKIKVKQKQKCLNQESSFYLFSFKNEMIYEEIRVCTDSSRLDFANSC